MADAPILVRPARTASQRWFAFCRLCPVPQYIGTAQAVAVVADWPGALAAHAKRPGEASDLGREHLRKRHPDLSGARPGLSPDSGQVQ